MTCLVRGSYAVFCVETQLRYLNNGYQDKIFTFKTVNESVAIFEHKPLFTATELVKEQLDSLKKRGLTKKEPTIMCPQELCTSRLPHHVDTGQQ